jgi:nucleoside-diphosphate-sugar epimerase
VAIDEAPPQPPQRIFLAGASGVIGRRLVPLLVERGHAVAGLTRSATTADELAAMGVTPVIADVYDADALTAAVVAYAPDLVMHQLTDLPDDVAEIADYRARNDRIRIDGTDHLLAAARAAGTMRFVAQSIAWTPPGGAAGVEHLEREVLAFGGVVIRYGQFYGPGTFHADPPRDGPRVAIADAARRTLPALTMASGILTVTDT